VCVSALANTLDLKQRLTGAELCLWGQVSAAGKAQAIALQFGKVEWLWGNLMLSAQLLMGPPARSIMGKM